MAKILSIDIMIGDRYYHTIKVEVNLSIISGYKDDKPIINYEKLHEEIQRRLPLLKRKKYTIAFNNSI